MKFSFIFPKFLVNFVNIKYFFMSHYPQETRSNILLNLRIKYWKYNTRRHLFPKTNGILTFLSLVP